MKDESGRVTLPGWYDGIHLSESDRIRLDAIPEDEEVLNRRLGIAKPEQVGDGYQEALQYPSLNVRGMASAWIGEEVRTIIPPTATAEIDIRLVPETDGERMVSLVKKYVEEQGYHFVNTKPTDEERAKYEKLIHFDASVSYNAFRTPFDSDIGRFLGKALLRAFDHEPVMMRTTGGSQPMGPFIMEMGLDAVALRITNPDNNIHSPNENLRLGNFLEGIQSCLAVLTEPLK
jgi:acetylornithine deacetylase/succinyl-diaminopimelate desuccinylase-like protein